MTALRKGNDLAQR
ncbi:Protein of unknown function [Propionibacterium freudenreichii subsp. freudenreichii]|uniref:Uncharacterized protein n=1 Tax=Propionibacterium freudenreichii subsp. freudenreichii TaxID=66712 RepID=A0A0B7NZU8_PROFF|nr:Protein of unknown function [Propionibacterium freudenreichii subsp. freudenreichii]